MRLLLPYYLLFLISIILFLKTDIRILYTFNIVKFRFVSCCFSRNYIRLIIIIIIIIVMIT